VRDLALFLQAVGANRYEPYESAQPCVPCRAIRRVAARPQPLRHFGPPDATGCGESLCRLQLAAAQRVFGVLRLNVPVKDEPALLPVELSYLVMYSVAAKLASNSAECIGLYTDRPKICRVVHSDGIEEVRIKALGSHDQYTTIVRFETIPNGPKPS
jgi:hypothetical protein